MIKERFIVLISNYLEGTATSTEQQLVEHYMDGLSASGEVALSNEEAELIKASIWRGIRENTADQYPKFVRLPWYKTKHIRITLAAASILLAVVLGLALLRTKEVEKPGIARVNKQAEEVTVPRMHSVVNTTGKQKKIRMTDGSEIRLWNNSEITWYEPFAGHRSINLTGMARFNVLKKGKSPFTVSAGAISTTAIGTGFTVTAPKDANQILVRLYSGRVVIKPVFKQTGLMNSEVYLLPGEEFIYDGITPAKVRQFASKHSAGRLGDHDNSGDDPLLPQNTRGTWYMFNNQPLAQVFDQLADVYEVHIVYKKSDIRSKYFVGRFNKSDSLDVILKYIAKANQLTVSKQDNIYIISNLAP